MGIHDRDYFAGGGNRKGVRVRGPRGGPLGGLPGQFRPWTRTVNAWLIIICIAVFVIDGFFGGAGSGRPSGWIETGRYWVHEGPAWVEVSGTPYHGQNIRPDNTHLGSSLVVETVNLQGSDGTAHPTRIQGLPVYDEHNNIAAVAEASPATPLMKGLHFSTKRVIGGAELWRLITFQFMHADMYHVLFNMMALYFFGSLIENVLGGKRYLAFYLICGVAGGLLYLLLNVAGYVWVEQLGRGEIPGLLTNATGTPLIGASAGVFGVLIGGAFLAPQARVLVFMVLPMRLATLAKLLIVISVASILFSWNNAGGEAAHLGGAIAGWAMIRHPERLHRFFDWLGRFDPTSRHFRRGVSASKTAGTDEIDRILAKISREGLHSLSDTEKKLLQRASEGEQG